MADSAQASDDTTMPPRKKPPTATPVRRSKRLRRPSSNSCSCSNPKEDLKEPVELPKKKKVDLQETEASSAKPVDMASRSVTLKNNSVSSQYRIKGNVSYGKAFQEGIAPVIKMSRLEEALRLYNHAVSTAEGPSKQVDTASALKNCGVVNKRMAEECQKQDKDQAKVIGFFQNALKHMNQAFIFGGEIHGAGWASKLQDDMESIYQDVAVLLSDLSLKEKLGELFRAVAFLPAGLTAVAARYRIADMLFKESVRQLEAGNFKACLSCLHDLHQPVEEALSIIRRNDMLCRHGCAAKDLQSDLKVMEQDATYHIAMAESLKTRRAGEEMLTRILDDEEYLNMDLLWIALDNFKEASLQAAELDLEQEAAALSYLGFVHHKLLFSRTRAKKYFKRCLELTEAAKPKTFHSEKWYKQCIQCFQIIQDIERSRDEAAQRKIRDEILEGMADEIRAIKEANSSASSLLEHLYKHHAPPKERKFTEKHLEELKKNEGRETEETQKARKKLLLKACQDFHPDKFRDKEGESKEDEAKRKVLMEEITKLITKYYEHLKFC